MAPLPRFATRSRVSDSSAAHITQAYSILAAGDIEDFSVAFPLPEGWGYMLPDKDETVLDRRLRNTVAVHFESLRGGLRFPLHPFIKEVLRRHRLLPGQLHPNSYTMLVAFIILSRQLESEPFLHVWYTMFMLDSKEFNKTGYYNFVARSRVKNKEKYSMVVPRSNLHHWKVKFVLVHASEAELLGPVVAQEEVILEPFEGQLPILTDAEKGLLEHFKVSSQSGEKSWHTVVTLTNLTKFEIATLPHPVCKETLSTIGALYGLTASKEIAAAVGERGKTSEAGASVAAGSVSGASEVVAALRRPSSPPVVLRLPKLKSGRRSQSSPTQPEAMPQIEEPLAELGGDGAELSEDVPLVHRKRALAEQASGRASHSEDQVVVEDQETEVLVDQTEVPVEDAGGEETDDIVDRPKKRKLMKDGSSLRKGRLESGEPGASAVELGASGSVQPPQPLEFQVSQVTGVSLPPWNLPPDFAVLSAIEDKRVGIATRAGWIRGALSERDNARLRKLSDLDLYHWMASNAVQLPALFAESISRLEEKEKCMVDLTVARARAEEAQARAVRAELEARQAHADYVSIADAMKVMKESLERTADDLAAERRKVQGCEASLEKEKKLTAELQDQTRTLHDKNCNLVIRLGEAEENARKAQEENAALRRDNEGYQLQFKEQHAKISKMKSVIQTSRFYRQELQKSLAKEEAYHIENYVNSQNFEDAMGDIVWDWYEAGFKVAKLQAKAAIEAGESSVPWNEEDKMGYAVPETVTISAEYLPQRSLDEKPPMEILKDWEAVAGDDIDADSDFAPPPPPADP